MTMMGHLYPRNFQAQEWNQKYFPITWSGQGKSLQRAPKLEASDV